jgi:hypothetical protein
MDQFGVIHLTGEGDALNIRAVFDLTEEGRSLVLGFLNLPSDTSLRLNVNNKGVASIALPRGMLFDLALFAYIRSGLRMAIHDQVGGYVMGVPLDVEESALQDYIDSNRDKLRIVRRKV